MSVPFRHQDCAQLMRHISAFDLYHNSHRKTGCFLDLRITCNFLTLTASEKKNVPANVTTNEQKPLAQLMNVYTLRETFTSSKIRV